MASLFNLAVMTVTGTPGTGTITLGSAATINGITYLSFAAAGVADGTWVDYSLADTGASEIGRALYTSAGTTLSSRTVLVSTNANTAINATSATIVRISPSAETLDALASYPMGRVTLQSGVPVMITNQTAKTTIYFNGTSCPLYDGTRFTPYPIPSGEISIATTDTTQNPSAIGASKVNDWYIWLRSGVVVLSHGPDRASDTAAGDFVIVNGIRLNNTTIGNGTTTGPTASRGTYVGTTRSNGSSQLDWIFGASAAGGTAAWFGLWNMYNRVNVTTTVTDSTASWNTATSATFGPMDVGATGSGLNNRISAVFGVAEDGIRISIFARVGGVSVAFANGNIGFAMDATNTADKFARAQSTSSGLQIISSATAENNYAPQTGFHFWQAVDAGDGTNAGSVAGGTAQGLNGVFRM